MQRALVAIAVMVGALVPARAALAAQACGITPVLLVVQDRSNSMTDPVSAGTSGSKWSIASSVVPSVLGSYQSGFDYGLMMYPASAADVCGTGTTVLGTGASVAQIQSSYQSHSPAGATPTATSLLAARDYLNSLNLSVPAYVLLITDGQPNCNGSLDRSTCTCTPSTNGCAGSSGTQYNCLDDTRTESAAAQVRAAGYPVYVVGFGSSSTANNNGAVLDAIASAGGTNHSYSALSTSGLQSALNSIVGGVTGCCTNTCNPGALTCSASGSVKKCEVQASGCYDWSTYPCASGSVCSGGACQTCNGTCTAGQTTCNGNGVSTCVANANGCTGWSTSSTCGSGELCGGGACQRCDATCTAGARRCASDGLAQACVTDADGCTSWQNDPCGAGTTCSGGICTGCNGCTVGESQCAGDVPLTCQGSGNGCSAWVPSSPCTGASVCQGGACLDCAGQCQQGATRCGSGGIETCTSQPNACNAWVATGACGSEELCANGACCLSQCSVGAVQCGADGSVQTCDASSGCGQWVSTACASGEQCSEGACKQVCNGNEKTSDCPEGEVCVDSGSGQFCQPGTTGGSSGSTGTDGSSGSTGNSGGTTGLGNEGGGTSGNAGGNGQVSGQGCNCGVVPPSDAMLALPFALMLLARRRRRDAR